MNMRSGEFLGGVLVGVLIGGALGLLFAPEAGEEVRQRIKERAGDYKNRAVETGSQWLEKSKSALRETKEQIAARVRGDEGEA